MKDSNLTNDIGESQDIDLQRTLPAPSIIQPLSMIVKNTTALTSRKQSLGMIVEKYNETQDSVMLSVQDSSKHNSAV